MCRSTKVHKLHSIIIILTIQTILQLQYITLRIKSFYLDLRENVLKTFFLVVLDKSTKLLLLNVKCNLYQLPFSFFYTSRLKAFCTKMYR